MSLSVFKSMTFGGLVSALILVSNTVMAESLPALQYKGKIMSGNNLSDRDCDFIVATDDLNPGISFVLGTNTAVHGVVPTPKPAEFFYFEASKVSSGDAFYSVSEDQEQSVLTLNYIQVRQGTDEVLANPNNIANLVNQGLLELSMIVSFKSGVSYEQYVQGVESVLSGNGKLDDHKDVLNSVDVMTMNMWHHNHLDRLRCANAEVNAIGVIDLVSDGHEDHDHDHGRDHEH